MLLYSVKTDFMSWTNFIHVSITASVICANTTSLLALHVDRLGVYCSGFLYKVLFMT